jgi:hypothetical protein
MTLANLTSKAVVLQTKEATQVVFLKYHVDTVLDQHYHDRHRKPGVHCLD